MKTKIHRIKTTTLEKFADEHGLLMVVKERGREFVDAGRFYACFEHVEISDGHLLTSVIGNGDTPEEAIADYTKRISEQRLRVDGKYIESPRLT